MSMELSRRKLLAEIAAVGSLSSIAVRGTQARFQDDVSESASLQAGTWGLNGAVAFIQGETLTTARHHEPAETYGVTDAAVLGAGRPAFGHTYVIPYITSGGNLELVTHDGTQHSLAAGGTSLPTQKTFPAVGTWNGDEDVFYTASSTIYRISPSDSEPTVVKDLGGLNGAKGVLGVSDIDEDDTDELVYIGGSGSIRYLNPAKADDPKIKGTNANNQYGVGAPFQTDNGPRIPYVDGSGNPGFVDVNGNFTQLATGGVAGKTALAASDVDNDDTPELVFTNSNGELHYLDDLTQQTTPQPVYDSTGSQITGIDTNAGILG
ncbi:hypothetical protein ACOZ32_14200 (plasmid) [Halobacterium sp. MBLA0001]|uniref:hypothetical protein n=1 Tax=Halobacterium sp. MBLA0001 TaxID=3413511 RepID=UPI003C73FC3F